MLRRFVGELYVVIVPLFTVRDAVRSIVELAPLKAAVPDETVNVPPFSAPPSQMNVAVVSVLPAGESVPLTRSRFAIDTDGAIETVAPLILTVPVPVNEEGALMLWVPFANPKNAPEAVLNVPVCVMIAGLL